MLPSIPTHRLAPTPISPAPQPIEFTHEAALYRLRIWTQRELALIPRQRRPRAHYVPGLGWVGGDFVAMLN
jgi:hypothetical protein